MSSIVNPVNPTEVQADKPVIETSLNVEQQTSSESTNQTDSLNNDTNSVSTQNEVSALKRDARELSESTTDEQTPVKSKKSRIDRFKEESEALLKSFGLKEGTESETRLTRSRTRGTPVSTPVVVKPEPKKQSTGAKRGRRPANKPSETSESKETEEVTKAPPQKKGRARPIRSRHLDDEEDQADVVENSSTENAEESTQNVTGDQNEETESNKVESNIELKEEKKVEQAVPKVVVTKEEDTPAKESKSTETPITQASPVKVEKKIVLTRPIISTISKVEPISKPEKPVEPTPNTNSVSEVKSSTNSVTNDTPKVETNNLPSSNNNQIKETPVSKTVESIEQPTKPVEEKVDKVVSNDAKLSGSAVEKQEVQTA